MRERPIQDLVDGLTQLGVDAQCTAGTGCPPVTVNAQGLPSGKVGVNIWSFPLSGSCPLSLHHSHSWPLLCIYTQSPPPPAPVHADADFAVLGVQVQLSGKVSSQYLTALLMAAPMATGSEGVDIQITDELVSQPYVAMTIKLMERFGVKVCLMNFTSTF